MKRYTLYIIVALLLLLCGCADASAEKGAENPSGENSAIEEISSEASEYTFYATVLETESVFGGILVEAEDEGIASPVVVHSEAMPSLSVGDRIRVEYSGQIALSYPGQIFGAKVSLVTE